jgi:hypothetical protein
MVMVAAPEAMAVSPEGAVVMTDAVTVLVRVLPAPPVKDAVKVHVTWAPGLTSGPMRVPHVDPDRVARSP